MPNRLLLICLGLGLSLELFAGLRVLVVPGFLPRPGVLARQNRRNPYPEVVAMLRRCGWDAYLSRVDPGGSIEDGWPVVARELAESPEPVVAIGHSLGGRKILRALVESLRATANVAGVLFLNTPHRGDLISEIASAAAEPERLALDAHSLALDITEAVTEMGWSFFPGAAWGRPLREAWFSTGRAGNQMARAMVSRRSLTLFEALHGGDPKVLVEVSREKSLAYLEEHQVFIRLLARRTPMLSVISYGDLPLSPFQWPLRYAGFENDGVVGVDEMRLGLGTLELNLGRRVNHLQMITEPVRRHEEWGDCLVRLLEAM